jgi:hypothetical protein
MKQTFVDQRGAHPPSNGLGDLVMYLEAADVQDAPGGGISIAVGLVNDGAHKVSLLNPYELLQFLLNNEAGFPLQLPQPAPSLLVHRADSAAWELDSPFPITEFSRNGHALDVAALNTPVIDLAAHETAVVRFTIDRFVEGGQDRALPPGLYRISAIATLLDAVDAQKSRVLEAPALQVRYAARGGKAQSGPPPAART